MVQALNSTIWKPTFLETDKRIAAVADKVQKGKERWIQVSTAVQAAADAAKGSPAAKEADKAKKQLYKDMIARADVPKYIPNDTFIDVVLDVLTSDKILEVLEKPDDPTTNSVTQSFWNRFSAAIGVVEGVSKRITDPCAQ